jgi:16S rRNA (guanine966-N2)-methyltransferase
MPGEACVKPASNAVRRPSGAAPWPPVACGFSASAPGFLRIVGGKFANRDLTSPNDFRVRPTAEHVRAALLDLLAADVKDARVLDLFAGTGALGLEAISRGARSADFVETRPSSLHALRANIASLRLRERTRVFKRDALPFAAALDPRAYDIAFVDPPYESRMLDRVFDAWRERRFSAILAVEHARGHDLPRGAQRRTFDETAVTIYRA